MLIKGEKITIVKVDHKQGVSKTTLKPYNFYTVIFVDDDLNRFESMIPNQVLTEGGVVPEWLLEAKKLECGVDLEILPNREFGVTLKVVNLFEE